MIYLILAYYAALTPLTPDYPVCSYEVEDQMIRLAMDNEGLPKIFPDLSAVTDLHSINRVLDQYSQLEQQVNCGIY